MIIVVLVIRCEELESEMASILLYINTMCLEDRDIFKTK